MTSITRKYVKQQKKKTTFSENNDNEINVYLCHVSGQVASDLEQI